LLFAALQPFITQQSQVARIGLIVRKSMQNAKTTRPEQISNDCGLAGYSSQSKGNRDRDNDSVKPRKKLIGIWRRRFSGPDPFFIQFCVSNGTEMADADAGPIQVQ